MNELDKILERIKELAGKSKSDGEVAEFFLLSQKAELYLAEEIKGLILALEQKNIYIKTIWDLVNTKKTYPEAIDILISHLPKDYHDKNKEGIVRALTVKEAKGKATAALKNEYEKIPKAKYNLRVIIGNAIATVMTIDDAEWIYTMVLDKSNGASRGQMVYALGTIKSEKSETVLINLLNDSEIAPQALAGLARLKSKKAIEKIRLLCNSTNSLIKLEAKKALKKIEN